MCLAQQVQGGSCLPCPPLPTSYGSEKSAPKQAIVLEFLHDSEGAHHLTENFENSGWKVNVKVTFREFQPKIEEYILRWSVHSDWYEPNRMLRTIYQFLGSFSVPDSRYSNCPFFWIQTVTDVAILQ